MKSRICEMLGVDFPLVAFSHCRDVVAAVSRAGGFGVLGVTAFSPDQLDLELKWIDQHIDGKPYGVDVLIPENLSIKHERGVTSHSLAERIPQQHREFVRDLLIRHGVEATYAPQEGIYRPGAGLSLQEQGALKLLEVSFQHPIKLIANALGVPPQSMLALGHRHGVPVAALVGAKEHAVRQAQAGVDIIIAEGWEAGGHCGEVSTLVLVPEVVRAIKPIRDIPVLAAGGIMTGRQMAACIALGAAGVWTGSVWLATTESEVSEIFREKMIAARSRDTVRSNAAPANIRGSSAQPGPTRGRRRIARSRCRCHSSRSSVNRRCGPLNGRRKAATAKLANWLPISSARALVWSIALNPAGSWCRSSCRNSPKRWMKCRV